MRNIKSICAYSLVIIFSFAGKASAQVPVRNEPHHKVVLENDYIRLIDVHIKPHDTTLTHIHAAPSVIVFLTKSSIATQIVGAAPVPANVMPAQTSYASYDEKSITHRVWNSGDSVFHVMDIELVKKDPHKDSCAVLSQVGAALQIQKKLVRVYNFDFHLQNKFQIKKSTCAYLVICVSGPVATHSANIKQDMQPGKFAFFNPQSEIEISGSPNAQCVLLEMK